MTLLLNPGGRKKLPPGMGKNWVHRRENLTRIKVQSRTRSGIYYRPLCFVLWPGKLLASYLQLYFASLLYGPCKRL